MVENQGVFLERESVPYDQDHAPMPSCPVHMEETLVSVPAGVGRHGTDVAEATPVCFSPDSSAPGSSGEGPERGGQSIVGSPILAGPGMVLRHHVTPGRPAVADPSSEQAGGTIFHPRPEPWKLWVWPLRGRST